MSHIAKSLQNINYGANIADNIISTINEQKQKDALNKYIGIMRNATTAINEPYQPQYKTVLGFKNPEVPIDTTQRNLIPTNNNQLPVTQAPTSNQMPSYQEQQPVDYNEANRKAINTVMDFINKSLPLQKDLPQGMTQQGLSALEMLRGVNQPKPHTYKNITPGGMEVELDEFGRPTGNVIKNPKEPVERNAQFKISSDGYYMKWDPQANDWIKTNQKAPEKDYKYKPSTIINNPAPPPDISSNVKDLTDLQKNFQYWDDVTKGKAKMFDKDGNEIKNPNLEYATSQKQAVFDKIISETDATANRLNSKYPGFERIYNALFQNSDIKNKKDIDKAIDEDMQGAPKDAIVQMKRLIHARVFNSESTDQNKPKIKY